MAEEKAEFLSEEETPTTASQQEADTNATESREASESSEAHGEQSEVASLKQEVSELKDKYLRLYSDFENFRKRSARERLDLTMTANEGLMSALLPVLDDAGRALKAADAASNLDAVKEGVQLVFHKLQKTLEQKGLKSMDVKQGDTFDAELHDAVTQFPAPSEELKGKIIDVIEQGYVLNEKPIRFAKVVTGS
ncbi:molecular chaperone GrpE [Catalinimonas alkaloidigena]|uniref:Protein GrpE n=1 Tax=Catalinimonas alkaloidigena TaxID=1075417 RepID=A0A1G9N503_9BACT|nr:nucleotide exchange factor GrpE [Catalinimonas alkaloidigena]SDL81599.1 molecular chaperone GrpE [Catalinimonas alkaloidigena]